MILGIGVDIVENARFDSWLGNPSKLERTFSAAEIELCRARGVHMRDSLAVRFAAKEAFVKAAGTGFRGLQVQEIQVLSDPLGRPVLELTGETLLSFQKLGGTRVHLSLSHEKNYSIATALIEAEAILRS